MIFPQQGLLINKHWYIFRETISASMQLTEIVLTHDTAVPALIPHKSVQSTPYPWPQQPGIKIRFAFLENHLYHETYRSNASSCR